MYLWTQKIFQKWRWQKDVRKYNLETIYKFDFKYLKILVDIRNKELRKIAKSTIISHFNTIKQRLVYLLKLVLNC